MADRSTIVKEVTQLQPHQQRVVTERNDLQVKFAALGTFLSSAQADSIDAQERARLAIQYSIMNAYLQVLELRIACFHD